MTVNTPILVESPFYFLSLRHYAPPELAARLFYASDLASAVRFGSHETFDRGLTRLDMQVPCNVRPYQLFIREHSVFYCFAQRTPRPHWLTDKLREDRLPQESVSEKGDLLLLRVNAGSPSHD